MNRSLVKRIVPGIEVDAGSTEGFASRISQATAVDGADLARLKAALKKAVAKTDAPAYLIDAIRREVRK